MKGLNKFNTALDLSKLSDDDRAELYLLTNTIYLSGYYLKYNQSIKNYIVTAHNFCNTLVDFETFKKIHFADSEFLKFIK